MRIVLDISRTVARARLPAATGIDRVERAYAGWALRQAGALFLARVGRAQYLLGAEPVRALLDWLDGEGRAPGRDLRALNPLRDERLARAQALVRRRALAHCAADDAAALGGMLAGMLGRTLAGPLGRPGDDGRAIDGPGTGGPGGVYLNVGHDNLDAAVIGGARAAGLGRAVMIHDVIPLDRPDFARAGTPARFRVKLDAAVRADLVLCNSTDTMERLRRAAGAVLPTLMVARLGIDPPPVARGSGDGAARGFVCLGTIEPRKNHALLLDVWERLVRAQGAAAPVLHIVGRRGWRNEAVFERLDRLARAGRGRGAVIEHAVIEHGALDDARAAALLAGARALLFPSHAEGFGLPLAEALALGVPAVASDLPALREVGCGVPEFLAPDDAAGWQRAVEDYAADPSPRRTAQLARLQGWRAPGWEAHFARVENALETILVHPAGGG